MKRPTSRNQSFRSSITAADVGRYLKQLASINRDPVTGNVAMSEALYEVAEILISAKFQSAGKALEKFTENREFEFEEFSNFGTMSLDKVKDILSRKDVTKANLMLLGVERFGIAKSRMAKVSREEIISTIHAAIQHEESLAIISEEARREGRSS